jgi:hypothetical protein
MTLLIMLLLVLHVLPGVFWAGSTFVLARSGGSGADRLFAPQMGAATLAVLAGIGLMLLLHRGPQGPMEHTLGIGAACALVAAGVQGGLRRRSPGLAQRLAAGLLAITIICMVIARYT